MDRQPDLTTELDQMLTDRVAAAVARRTRTANTRAAFNARRTAGKARGHADRLANSKEDPMPTNGSTVTVTRTTTATRSRCRYLTKSGRITTGIELTRCSAEVAEEGSEIDLCQGHLAKALALLTRRLAGGQ
jgi:hypothetical protein